MDKTTLSHYGWICIVIFILTVYIAIATPFGVFVTDSAKYMLQGLFDTKKTSMDAADIEIIENEFDDSWNGQWDENTPVQEDIFETSVAYALILDNGMGADTVPLVFTRSKTEIKVGDKYNSTTYGERTVVASFTGFEDIEYSYGNGGKTTAPWSTYATNITSVQVEQPIRPISMTGWFAWLERANILNLAKIDTSRCTSLRCTFYKCGYDPSVSSFNITGLDTWDTSNVVNMVGTFSASGHSSARYTIEGLNKWDTSSVQDFEAFFASAGYNSKNWEMDLTGFSFASAKSISQMFAHAGRFCTQKIVIKGLDTWDVSNVQNMMGVFYMMGTNIDFTIDISMWNPASVTNKTRIIEGIGGTILLPDKLK